jgi:hypothetical protein
MNYNSFAAEHELLTFCMQMIEKGTGKKMEQKWERSLPGVGAAWLLMLTVAHGGVMAVVVLLLLTEGDRLFFSSFPLFSFFFCVSFSFFLYSPSMFSFLLCFPFPFLSSFLSLFSPISFCSFFFLLFLSFFLFYFVLLSIISPVFFSSPAPLSTFVFIRGKGGKRATTPV